MEQINAYQWDTDITVSVPWTGAETPLLDFTQPGSAATPAVQPERQGSTLTARCPPSLLQRPRQITVYTRLANTVALAAVIHVIPRPKPEEYVAGEEELATWRKLQAQIDALSGTSGGGAVHSVNGQTGAVTLTAADVGALPDTTAIPSIEGLASEEYVDRAVAAVSAGEEWVELLNVRTEAETAYIQIDVGKGKAIKKLRVLIMTGSVGLSSPSVITLRATPDGGFTNSNWEVMAKTPGNIGAWGYPVFILESGENTFPIALAANGSVNGNTITNVAMGGVGQNYGSSDYRRAGPWRCFKIIPNNATFNEGVSVKVWGVYE